MNAVLMDNVKLGDECIVGALTFIAAETVIPNRKVVVGNPSKIVKDVSDEMLRWKTEGTALYQALPAQLTRSLRPCQPLYEVPKDRPTQMATYKPWKSS
jgi:carbonic anhydrase/acetyltransferase-like protein (isoleucine patch superfamily)